MRLKKLLHMIVQWNAKKMYKLNKKFGEITKVFKGFSYQKRVVRKNFFKKALEQH